jgi:hypothetical protein
MLDAVDPAADLNDDAIDELYPFERLEVRIEAGALTTQARTVPARRRRALVLSGVLATIVASAAVILGVVAAVPGPPNLGSPVLRVEKGPSPAGAENNGPSYDYQYSANPNLASASGSATAYELVAPTDLSTITGTIADAFGLSGPVAYEGPGPSPTVSGTYQVGPNNGPYVAAYSADGVIHWMYTASTSDEPRSSPVITHDEATMEAQQILQSIGDLNQYGSPSVSQYGASVVVDFPMVVDGLPTDQTCSIAFLGSSFLAADYCIIATPTPAATYPTIAPTQAIDLLPQSGGTSRATGVSGATGPNGLPIVDVAIDQASQQLATYNLTDGTSWLLPTWALSGPESGTAVPAGSTFASNVLAVPAQYVQLAPALAPE